MSKETQIDLRQLDEQLANLLEPKPSPPPDDEAFDLFMFGNAMKSPLGFWRAVCEYEKGDIPEWQPIHLSSNIAAAVLVEDRIKELGLEDEYVEALRYLPTTKAVVTLFDLIHASAEDRCRAGLKVAGGEER